MALSFDALDPFADRDPIPELAVDAPHDEAPPRTAAQRFWRAYARAFSLHEIEQSVVLQWMFVGLLIGYYITFAYWTQNVDFFSKNVHRPWPWFLSSAKLMVLSDVPHVRLEFFTGTLVALGACALFIKLRRWRYAHATMLVLFAVKGTACLINSNLWGNYHLFHLSFSLFFLFIPNKLYFIRRQAVCFYVLAGVLKLHDGWLLGTYFSSLKFGMPIFPEFSIPLMTNFVIVLELALAWLLLSQRWKLQRAVLILYLFFHIYSATMVGFLYPSIVTPIVLIAFGPRVASAPLPLRRGTLVPVLYFAVLSIGHFYKYALPGDPKLTMVGNEYGVYMFEANHQCTVRSEIVKKDGTSQMRYFAAVRSMDRCEPFTPWYYLRRDVCTKPDVARVAVQWDHSIDGGPFYRMIDTPDMCSLSHHPFLLNDWVKLPEQGAEIVGYPVQNYFDPNDGAPGPVGPTPNPIPTTIDPTTGRRLIVPPRLAGNRPVELTWLQARMAPLVKSMKIFWWLFFAVVTAYHFARALRRPKPQTA